MTTPPTSSPASPTADLGLTPEPQRIVVVEDDPESARILGLFLRRAGYLVDAANRGDTGLELIRCPAGAGAQPPDLVILDLMLPGLDGWSVCREIRRVSEVPILILSARQEEQDRLLGLGLGADDYVVKPFSPREVVLRVQAILRRARSPGAPTASPPVPHSERVVGDGAVRVDLDRRAALVDGRAVSLTPSEFRLLHTMVLRAGRTFERRELIDILYPHGGTVVPKAIDVHVGKLRQKLERDAARPRHLVTVRGFGYRWEP